MIDYEKFASYSEPVPRYTSYPTAPEFSADFSEQNYADHIARSNESARALSLYFHLPFCRSACYFCGCNVIYTSKDDLKERYIDYLEAELAIMSKKLDTKRIVSQIHFGGGTPTFFSAAELERIIGAIDKRFSHIAKGVEFGVEIDPRFFSQDQMIVLRNGGVNRISFGVQDFDPKVQESVHRIQPLEQTKNAVDIARNNGVESINIDLIYGLPFQSVATFENTLRSALLLNPDRIALFNYAHVPWMKKTMRKLDETTLPCVAVKLKMLQMAVETFENAGLMMIGMDHFSRASDPLNIAQKNGKLHRNFQGYTTHSDCDLFGFGVTSIGEGVDFYAQNYRDLAPYEAAIDAGKLPLMRGFALNEDDRLRKTVINTLMSNFTLDFTRVESEFKIDFRTYFAAELAALKPLENDGLITISDRSITASLTGRLLIRNVVMHFDRYLKKQPQNERRFSKSV
ncbi:coproporphyrinogen-III oxidase [Campylobacterota bacterium]|nr:coproporphyrinogen-III oxidase [Campylobacterota bacterium]